MAIASAFVCFGVAKWSKLWMQPRRIKINGIGDPRTFSSFHLISGPLLFSYTIMTSGTSVVRKSKSSWIFFMELENGLERLILSLLGMQKSKTKVGFSMYPGR